MPNISLANISKIRLAEQGSDPSAPAATFWLLYIKSDGLYIIDSANNITGPLNVGDLTQAAADLLYAPIAKGVTNGDTHDHSGGDGAQIDHGGLGGLADNDHPQYALEVKEADGAPDVTLVKTLIVTNGKLTDNGGGSVSLDLSGSGFADPMSAAGDMIRRSAANSTEALAIGTVGQILTARGGTLIPTWETQYSTINFIIDGGGSAITTGVKGDLVIDFACNIVSWTILADQSGAIKIDIWRDSYANFPPTDADTITNAHEPEIPASGASAQDTDLSDWITNPPAITAGQTLRFNVDSCTTITRATLALKVART